MKNNLCKIVIVGALWGIFEATAGYALHVSGIKIGSFIWFPVAYYFCHRVYSSTQSYPAVMLTAFIAAAIKLVNLFFPGRIDMVINPAVSIVLEAMAVVLVYKYVANSRIENINPLTVALTGFIWRGLYVWYIFSMPAAYFSISSLTATEGFLQFMFVKNLINIVIICAGFAAAKLFAGQLEPVSAKVRQALNRKAFLNPAVAAAAVAAALTVQVWIG